MPPPAPEGPRHAVVTWNDHGAILQIVTWFLMVVMILAAFLKFAVRAIARGLGLDDIFVSFALLFGIGEVIALSLGVNHGLGKKADLLSAAQIISVEKSQYASSLLYILTLAFAKGSIILLMSRLFSNDKKHVLMNQILAGVVVLWAIAAFFGVAFQCDLPDPWNHRPGKCINIDVFWYIIGAVDILLDLAFIILPAIIVQRLQMDFSRKVIVVSAFLLRIFVVAAQITRLALLSKLDLSADPTYPIAFWIATVFQTALAVVASCAPALKPFMGAASSGLMGVSLTNREGTYNVTGSYHMQDMSKKGGSNGTPQQGRSKNRANSDGNFSTTRSSHRAFVSSRKGKSANGYEEHDDASDKYIIRKTTEYDVMYSQDGQRVASVPRQSVEESNDTVTHNGVRYHDTL